MPERDDLGEELFGCEADRDLIADVLVDRVEGVDIVVAGQGEGLALGADPGGAADAVDVVLGVLRQIEVDDVGDAVDVKTAARDIGGDEDRQLAVAEVVRAPSVAWSA